MVAIGCTILSGVLFYFSIALGPIGLLAWIAPIPVMWLAFGKTRPVVAFFSAWAALSLGALNLLPAYGGILPTFVLALGILGPGLLFAAALSTARFVARRLSPLAGVLAFAVLWTALDYVASLGNNGSAPSPSYSQVATPVLIQSASLFGLWIVTFLLGFVAAGLAMSLRKGSLAPALAAVALFAANLGYGLWHEAKPLGPSLRIGLAGDDSRVSAAFRPDAETARATGRAYTDAARLLARQGAKLIVLPEKNLILKPAWKPEIVDGFSAAARETGADIVVGFDDHTATPRNEALVFGADGSVRSYFKRHMVPGLEDVFVPGATNFVRSDRTGVVICKDMDFQNTIRADAIAGHPTLMAVPAWDFDGDRRWHASLAIMRGVENGFSLARAAKVGLLTLSDAHGKVIAERATTGTGMVTLIGDLPRGPGATVYSRIGDVFAWGAILVSLLLLGLSASRPAMRNR
jgi:apolipoprotein N-acyltransferase